MKSAVHLIKNTLAFKEDIPEPMQIIKCEEISFKDDYTQLTDEAYNNFYDQSSISPENKFLTAAATYYIIYNLNYYERNQINGLKDQIQYLNSRIDTLETIISALEGN